MPSMMATHHRGYQSSNRIVITNPSYGRMECEAIVTTIIMGVAEWI